MYIDAVPEVATVPGIRRAGGHGRDAHAAHAGDAAPQAARHRGAGREHGRAAHLQAD